MDTPLVNARDDAVVVSFAAMPVFPRFYTPADNKRLQLVLLCGRKIVGTQKFRSAKTLSDADSWTLLRVTANHISKRIIFTDVRYTCFFCCGRNAFDYCTVHGWIVRGYGWNAGYIEQTVGSILYYLYWFNKPKKTFFFLCGEQKITWQVLLHNANVSVDRF